MSLKDFTRRDIFLPFILFDLILVMAIIVPMVLLLVAMGLPEQLMRKSDEGLRQ